QAVNVGRSIAADVRAVLVSDEPEDAVAVRARWDHQLPDVPLVVVESPYRTLVGPLLAYLDVLDAAWPPDKPEPITFVVIPEYVARSWWERILYNQSAKRLRSVLLGRPHTVVVAVPYRREDPALFEAALGGERQERPEADGRLTPPAAGRPPGGPPPGRRPPGGPPGEAPPAVPPPGVPPTGDPPPGEAPPGEAPR